MGAQHHADKELTDLKQPSPRASRMKKALQERFNPLSFELIDESSRHAGHGGARPEGETHFRIRMTADAFTGQTRVNRQRLINEALREEFEAGLHALAMELRAPGE